jgi:hypothetical protein
MVQRKNNTGRCRAQLKACALVYHIGGYKVVRTLWKFDSIPHIFVSFDDLEALGAAFLRSFPFSLRLTLI